MKKYILYCHTNKINGKKYIGITSTKPEKRWQNGKGYSSNSYFNSAILKYGWDSFSHEIWYTDLTVDEANALEIEMIKKYNSANREFGYNIDLGGNQTGKVSEETKRKHRENQLGEKKPLVRENWCAQSYVWQENVRGTKRIQTDFANREKTHGRIKTENEPKPSREEKSCLC